jgi:hypothetical protein
MSTRKFLGFVQDHPESRPRQLRLEESERRKTHMLVLGSPGSGKSKFLEWSARGDTLDGHGLCILDIHGSLYQDVKRWLSYNYFLTRKVILLDPSGGEHILGFNPFRPKPGVELDVQVAGMVQALLRVWGAENTNETPTLDRVLRLVFTAMIIRRIPLHEIVHLINFDERQVREDVIASFSEPVVRRAWEELQSVKSRGQWRDEVLSTQNRLFRLAYSPTIRRFMGVVDERYNINPLEIMNEGKILLVNLKESRLLTEDNAKAFAALLLNDFFKSAIMFRDRDKLGHDPRPFYMYVDEWQNIVTPDIKKILAQARKFGLLLTLANQDLSQIADAFGENFVNTLLTCCQIKVCFGGLNRNDAKRMVEEMLVKQLDLDETKNEIASTKFWPVYGRDTVRTYSRSSSQTTGRSRSTANSSAQGTGTSVQYTWTPEGWATSPGATGGTENSSSIETQSSMEGETESESTGEGESVADIPILMPEPFEEVTSRTTYTLEEQIWRTSDCFMEQYQRHCFIKLPGQKTVAMLVPVVDDPFVHDHVEAEYERDIARLNAANEPAAIDALLAEQPSLFLTAENPPQEPEEVSDENLYE